MKTESRTMKFANGGEIYEEEEMTGLGIKGIFT